jgi:alpha-beta hydrolase superfamily lysophospholipase
MRRAALLLLSLLVVRAAAAEPLDLTLTNPVDGTQLHAIVFRPEAPKAGLLMIHGMQSHTGWIAATGTGDHLAANGVLVLAYDRRGSGRSGGRRGHADSAEDFLSDLDTAMAALRRELAAAGAPGAPVHLFANCFGTRTALPWVANHESGVASVILTSPATHMARRADYGLLARLGVLLSFDSRMVDTPLRDDYYVDPGRWLDFIEHDDLSLRKVSARFLKSANTLTHRMEDAIPRLRVPLLVLLAERDVIVVNEDIVRDFVTPYRGPKALAVLPGPHFMDFTEAQPRFREQLLGWIEYGAAAVRVSAAP